MQQDLSILIGKLQRDVEGLELGDRNQLNWIDIPGAAFQVVALAARSRG